MSNLKISDERIRRATLRIGKERARQRAAVVDEFLSKPLPEQAFGKPAGAAPPPIACVMADGGRFQVLDRRQTVHNGEHWRESRVATLLAMDSETHETDPTPELPEFLRDVSIARTLAEIGRVQGQNPSAEPRHPDKKPKDPPWPRPKILAKTMQASSVCWEEFGPMMASHAWHQGFDAAALKVFVSDGSMAIEKVQRRHFSHYVSVLDLMHALSYCLAAARASAADLAVSWTRYVRWATQVWQGQVANVIKELDELQHRLGQPEEDATQDDPKEIIRRARVYYTNHKSRMDYPDYRRQGFPLTSAVMESSVKQVNRRVKGTEKFWSTGGGEAILTLRADYLSDTKPMAGHWHAAQRDANGLREYRQTT